MTGSMQLMKKQANMNPPVVEGQSDNITLF